MGTKETRSEQFAEILTEGIYAIKRAEGKKISVIQDDLNYAIGRNEGNPIEYWRRGHPPTATKEFELLGKQIVKRGKLSREWLTRYLKFLPIEKETDRVLVADRVIRELYDPEVGRVLSPSPHKNLLGREAQIAHVFNCFRLQKNAIIAIDGMGGIGKTSLAYEAANRALTEKLFDAVYWITDEGLIETGVYTSEYVLNELGNKIGIREFSKQPFQQRQSRLKAYFALHKVLIVIDNLERANDSQDGIVALLYELIGDHSQVILISRRRFLKSVYNVHLQGLPVEHAVKLLTQEADSRGIFKIHQASPLNLAELAEKCGGSPLALKLVVGQLDHQSLQVVIQRMQNVELLTTNFQDEYSLFYRNIFWTSWELLTQNGQALLFSISLFSPRSGGTLEAISATCGLSENETRIGIAELWKMAFLEISDPSINQVRYFLHALTHYFAQSDAVKSINSGARKFIEP